mgnify:CR=1 FL=1
MNPAYPHLASRIFNTPLLLQPDKLTAIVAGLGPRLIPNLEPIAAPPSAYTTAPGQRAPANYRIVDGIGVVDIIGLLAHRAAISTTDSSAILGYDSIARQISAALIDPAVRAIVLNIDSPGGEVSGAFQLADHIRKSRPVKPIHAIASDLAASAGYLIASAAESISLTETAQVGSIGVVTCHADYSQALSKAGIAITPIFAGAHKVDGHPWAPLPEAVAERIQADIDHYYALFVSAVAVSRPGLSEGAIRATEAALYIGPQAVRVGLADRIETPDQLIARLTARPRQSTPSKTPKGSAMSDDAPITSPAAEIPATPPTLSAAIIAQRCLAAGESALGRALLNAPQTEASLNARLEDAREIRALAKLANLIHEAEELILSGISADAAAHVLINKKADIEETQPVDNRITNTVHQREKAESGITSALLIRAGLEKDDPKNEHRGKPLVDLAKTALEASDCPNIPSSKMALVGMAFTHSTSDFPNVLRNVAEKAALRGFDEAEETFEVWTSEGSLTDFKTAYRVGTSPIQSLREVPELAEFKHVTLSDRGAQIFLKTFGELFTISRQAIINDDLQVFTKIPTKFGMAAKRTIGDAVYALINDNANAPDGTALFHASHNNLLTAAGTPPTVAALGAARTAMRRQTMNDVVLNITPSYLLVPVTLEDTATTVTGAIYDPGATTLQQPNPVLQYRLKVVSDPRLDAVSTAAWYLVAGKMFDTIEVAYLDGQKTPYLEQQAGLSVDGVTHKVRMDFGVSILEHRTFYMNDGNP